MHLTDFGTDPSTRPEASQKRAAAVWEALALRSAGPRGSPPSLTAHPTSPQLAAGPRAPQGCDVGLQGQGCWAGVWRGPAGALSRGAV